MFNAQRPQPDDLPTSRQLAKATIGAMAAAGALLVAVILPAEYAIDPTGIGHSLGLMQMGAVKAQLAEEAAADAAATALAAKAAVPAAASSSAAAPQPAAASEVRSDVTSLTLNPGQGAEIKATMAEGLRLTYDWSVSGGAVNYDTHAVAQTPSGRLLRRSSNADNRPALFAAHFAISHSCWLITYPLAGWVGASFGLSAAATALAVIAALGVGAAILIWPKADAGALAHRHVDLADDDPHWAEAAHDGRGQHCHEFVIDALHTHWPSDPGEQGRKR